MKPDEGKVPAWRRALAQRPPLAAWWLRRHHCSEVVLGQTHKAPQEVK